MPVPPEPSPPELDAARPTSLVARAQTLRPTRAEWLGIGLCVVLALGAWLRLWNLEQVDLRGDEVTYYLDVEDRIDLVDYAKRHFVGFGSDRQMPLPRVLGASIVRAAGWEVDERAIRLPFVAAGVATIAAFWLLGWQLGIALLRRRDEDPSGDDLPHVASSEPVELAVCLAVLVCINPFHIYWSRTAHIYVWPMLFLGLAIACGLAWWNARARDAEGTLTARGWLAATCLATICASYAHMSAWIGAAMLWLVLLGAWLRGRGEESQEPDQPGRRWPIALAVAIAGWAVAILPWAILFLRGLLADTADPVWSETTNPLNRLVAMWRLPFIMTWGGGWRSLLTLGLPAAALVAAARSPRTGRSGAVRLVLVVAAVLFVLLSAAQSTGFYAVRYYVPLWPLLILLSGIGMLTLTDLAPRTRRHLALGGGLALIAATTAPALDALLSLRGNPAELRRLSEALDDLVEPGTPALVNGMNVVLYEMRPYLPDRAIPTFTVPDVGFAMWRDNDWRGSVETFFESFPQAVLVQQGRNFYAHPETGPWSFPEEHFAEQLVLRNEPAIRLRRMLLAGSVDFYTGSIDDSRAVTRLHVNTEDDRVAAAAAEGRELLALFGTGWSYRKALNLTEWMAMEDRATLTLHNLADRPRRVRLTLPSTTPQGRKSMVVRRLGNDASEETLFEQTLPSFEGPFSWSFDLDLEPGRHEVELADDLFSIGRAPLLIARLEVETLAPDRAAD
ncbi:MAG: hypothetical protein AAGN46_03690 [Acidobacteriota bacterium]